jgi:hypothetical protein
MKAFLEWTDTGVAISASVGIDAFDPDIAYNPTLANVGFAPASQISRIASPTEQVYKRDPYSISDDGHLIGDDGFIVPSSFEEFIERYPRYVRDRVRLWSPNHGDWECEDQEGELVIFLMSLPDKSKFRVPGLNRFPDGCKDRIQTFDPDRAYGASAPRFFNYIKIILRNRLISLWQKAASDPMQAQNTRNFEPLDPNETVYDEDQIFALASERGIFVTSCHKAIENSILVEEFLRFVNRHNPELLDLVRAIQMTDTYVEAEHAFGQAGNLFMRGRRRLGVLYSCFDEGTDPPRQRKVYRSRTQ